VLYNYIAASTSSSRRASYPPLRAVLSTFDTGLPEPGSGTVEANLIAYAEAALALVTEALPMAAGLISEPALLHRFIMEIHREPFGPHRLREPLANYLAGEQKLGRLGQFPPHAALSLILGPVIMLGFTELVGGVPEARLPRRYPM
jgi:hypothetical protein